MTYHEQIFSTPISVFKNAMSTEPVTITLGTFLQSKRHIKAIETIRQHNNKAIRDDLKKRLPAATISGTFRTRNIAGIVIYNGILCMDFDHGDNAMQPGDMKSILSQFSEVAYAGTSVGGKGVFAIIPTNNNDPAQHGRIVDFMGSVLRETGLVIDRACKDVCRLRFVSYDPQPYINTNPDVFDAARHIEQQRSSSVRRLDLCAATDLPSNYTRTRVEQCIIAIEALALDITRSYQDWYLIGFALASEFGTQGEIYYQRVSRFHQDYDYTKTAKKYADLCRNGGNSVRIGTFFKICQDAGIPI